MSDVDLFSNYLFISSFGSFLLFYITQSLSTLNFGGNQGNYQIGTLPLLALFFPIIIQYILYPNRSNSPLFVRLNRSFVLVSLLLYLFFHFNGYPLRLDNLSTAYNKSYNHIRKNLVHNDSQYIIVDGNTSLLAGTMFNSTLVDLSHIMHLSLSKIVLYISEFGLYIFHYSSITSSLILSQTPEEYSSLTPRYSFFNISTTQTFCEDSPSVCVGFLEIR